jgi:tripartite-type tricarboxylate transporter receptor subunit TctC
VQAQSADKYPDKPIRIVVPFAPGGSVDVLGRLLAQRMHESWGQSVIVENRPGAAT